MKSNNWKDIAELVGILAILSGLYFVYAELQQSGALARSELRNGQAQVLSAIDQQLRDSDFAALIYTSRVAPGDLTEPDQIRLNAFFNEVIRLYRTERYNFNRGIFVEWKSMVTETAPIYFADGYGRAYWEGVKGFYDAELISTVDDAIENAELVDFWDSLNSRIREELEKH